jgi:Ca2+-binding RTX toxin-like protein
MPGFVTITGTTSLTPNRDADYGSGYYIGDDLILTAGHNIFFANEENVVANRAILRLSGWTVSSLDLRGYESFLETYFRGLPYPLPADRNSSAEIGAQISVRIRDTVFLVGTDNVDRSDAGVVLFLNSADIILPEYGLSTSSDTVTVSRRGETTSANDGQLSFLTAGGFLVHSAFAQRGDSGGALIAEFRSGALDVGNRDFIIGNIHSIFDAVPGGLATGPSRANYFSAPEFFRIMTHLESSQAGDVTRSEPTNLIVGTSSGDSGAGSYRSDIILGRDGDDTLDDGDKSGDVVWANDQLYGGAGNDILSGGNGNDLLHGGDNRDYGASRIAIQDDGEDNVDYQGSITRSASQKGLTIIIAPAGFSGAPAWTYGATTDQSTAIYVIDQQTTGTDSIGSDTLISIENIRATGADDTLRLDVFGGQKFAGADGKGGIFKIDLAGNAEGKGKGDFIDASMISAGLTIDLSGSLNNVSREGYAEEVLTVLGAERVMGGIGTDTITGNAANNELAGGGGGDTLRGGGGDDRLYANTFSENTINLQNDNGKDIFDGGAGADSIFAGNGDEVQNPDAGDKIYLNGRLLTGGESKEPPRDPCNPPPESSTEETPQTYTGSDGAVYTLSGSNLIVSLFGGSLTITNFKNGDAGINLKQKRPDTDQAECQRDPLIIDLDGDRNVVRELFDSQAYFDLDNDGFAEHVAWSLPSDGLLVRDLNGNGLIENGNELFGSGRVEQDVGRPQQRGTAGFAELRTLDTNRDGIISALDTEFETLRVWVDANGDAITDDGELKSLSELGLVTISLTTRRSDNLDCACDGTSVATMSSVTRANGTKINIYDAYLAIDQYDTREIVTDVVISEDIAALPFLIGSGTLSDLDVAMARDPGLEEMLREFAALGTDDVDQIADRVEQVLFRWTGADQIAEDSRGTNINARWLHVLEQVSGSAFRQAVVGPNPRVDAAAILVNEYSELFANTLAGLLGQTALGQVLLPGLQFESAAFFTLQEGQTLQGLVNAAAEYAPDTNQAAMRYWATIISALEGYGSDGAINLSGLSVVLDPILLITGIPLNTNQLRDAVIGTSSQDLTVNNSLFRNIDTADVIIADDTASVLVGKSETTAFVIGATDGLVRVDATGFTSAQNAAQTVIFSEHTRADFDISVALKLDLVEQYSGDLVVRFVSRIDGTIVEIPARFSESGLRYAVSSVQFAGEGLIESVGLVDFIRDGVQIVGSDSRIFYGSPFGTILIEGGSVDDLLLSFQGNDTYRFGPNNGNDRIVDSGGQDTLELIGNRNDYRFERAGPTQDDLRIVHVASGTAITIFQHLSAAANEFELFSFSDGTTLTNIQVTVLIATGTADAQNIRGTVNNDTIDGAGGGDTLDGRAGADAFVIRQGYGITTIVDTDSNGIIRFGEGINLDDLRLANSGNLSVIYYGDDDDSVVIRRSNAAASSPIETIEFADDSSISFADFARNSALLTGAAINGQIFGTVFDETLTGTSGNDLIYGLGGRDTAIGGGGNDTFVVGEGRLSIAEDAFTFDTVLVPEQYLINDLILEVVNSRLQLRFAGSNAIANLSNGIATNGDRDQSTSDDIEQIVFADGRVIDLTLGSIVNGTSGNDILFSWKSRFALGGTAEFRPGAGDDYIFGMEFYQRLYLSAGFGKDVFLPDYNAEIVFEGISLNSNTIFRRDGENLIISFANSSDILTVRDVFSAYGYESIRWVQFSNTALTYLDIVDRVSISTPGDDLLFWQVILNGGAGNDILIGDFRENQYVFGRGSGNDIVKDRGYATVDDTLTLTGLNRNDVSFSRDPGDPRSIMITINDTGETIIIDSTAFDGAQIYNKYVGFYGGFQPLDNDQAQIERIVFADGEVMSQVQIEQIIINNERSSGSDTIIGFSTPFSGINAGSILNGGAGDDIFLSSSKTVNVAFDPNVGQDVLINSATEMPAVFVRLDSNTLASDIYVLFDIQDSRPVTIVRSKFGTELRIVDQNADGSRARVTIVTQEGRLYSVNAEGGLIVQTEGTEGTDYLRGNFDFNGGGESGGDDIFGNGGTYNERFTPGQGDDVINGQGGRDVIEFNRGDGIDTLLGDQNQFSSVPIDRPVGQSDLFDASSSNAKVLRNIDAHGYVIEFGDGISGDDIDVAWFDALTQTIRISIEGSNDSITVNAAAIRELRFTDGTTAQFNNSQAVFFVNPGQFAPNGSSNNETFIATNGNATFTFAGNNGRDVIFDQSFNAALNSGELPDNWSPNKLQILNGESLNDFIFIRDANNPNNLVIRNINTDEEVTIQNQFALENFVANPWQSADTNDDGQLDWTTLDIDSDGKNEFALLDTDNDGTPNWNNPDFDGDGEIDWQRSYEARLYLNGPSDRQDAYAADNNNDGFFENYYLDSYGNALTVEDIDGDGIPDRYYDFGTDQFVAPPLDSKGNADWLAIDSDLNGTADFAGLDYDNDGIVNWLPPYTQGSATGLWEVTYSETTADFSLEGSVSRRQPNPDGSQSYSLTGFNGSESQLILRDSDGDGQVDQYAVDLNYDDVPDGSTFTPVIGMFILGQGSNTSLYFFEDIAGRVVTQAVDPNSASFSISLTDLVPRPTPGVDQLVLTRSTGRIDTLAGNDIVRALESNTFLSFGRGDGNDVFESVRVPDYRGQVQPGYHRVEFDGIASLNELRFTRGGRDLNDLVVTIANTGETLTIQDQFRTNSDGDGVPSVTSFSLGDEVVLDWSQIRNLVEGASVTGNSDLSTDALGGLLNGGAGSDTLRGGIGNDTYVLGRGFDEDIVRDAGGFDTIQFGQEIQSGDVFFSRVGTNGNDLLIEIGGIDRLSMTVQNQFASDIGRVERFSFNDGSTMTWRDVQTFILNNSATGASESINGFITSDNIDARAGNDLITGDRGDDGIDGGAGRDVATYRGARADYEITTIDMVTTIRDLVTGRDGTDTLTNVEELRFAGGEVVLLNAPNVAPVAMSLAVQTNEDQEIVISRAQLLQLVSDANGDVVSFIGLEDQSDLSAWFDLNGNLRVRPKANFVGTGSFNFAVSDGNGAVTTGSVTVDIRAMNDAPKVDVVLENISVLEDSAVSITLPEGAFSDVDTSTLTLTARLANGDSLPAWLVFADGKISGQPPADYNGEINIVITASDGEAAVSSGFSLSVLAVQDAPRVASEIPDITLLRGSQISVDLATYFVDPDGDMLSYALEAANSSELPSWLTLNGSILTGIVPSDFEGPLNIVARANDGRTSGSDIFVVALRINTAPVVSNPVADASVAEDSLINVAINTGSFSDLDGDVLAYTALLANGDPLPSWLTFDAAAQRFTGTPPSNFNGFVDVRVTASDNILSVSDDFRLTVTPLNDAPVAFADADLTAIAGTTLVILPATLLANDNDVDGDTLLVTTVNGAVGGTVSIDAEGQIVYSANEGYQGIGGFDYTISDGTRTVTNTVTLQVNAPVPSWVYGTSGIDIINALQNEVNWIDGLEGDDFLNGGSLRDSLVGGLGNDLIDAGGGNDTVAGNEGSDRLNAGSGTDTIDYSNNMGAIFVDVDAGFAIETALQAGTVIASTDIVSIDLITQFENVNGTAFGDRIYGTNNDNTIAAGAGFDIVYGEGGIDTLDYSAAIGAVFADLEGRLAYESSSTTATVNAGSTFFSTDYVYGIENITGTAFGDRLYGNASANRLDGGNGADILYGGAGNDILIGGLGDDRIIGEAGVDIMTGSSGADRFYFSTVAHIGEADIITDFVAGWDSLLVSRNAFGIGAAEQLNLVVNGPADQVNSFIYDSASGNLLFDADGAGGGAAIAVADIGAGLAFTSADIVLYG